MSFIKSSQFLEKCQKFLAVPWGGTYGFLLISVTLLTSYGFAQGGQSFLTYRNLLRPFSSDACSFIKEELFFARDVDRVQRCCLAHDISYWVGGTEHQREIADKQFKGCLHRESNLLGSEVAAFYFSVRMGGHPMFPMSWRWGYGWEIPRGYRELAPSESLDFLNFKNSFVTEENQFIKAPFLKEMPESITGDYCLDVALEEATTHFKLSELKYFVQERPNFIFEADQHSGRSPIGESLPKTRSRMKKMKYLVQFENCAKNSVQFTFNTYPTSHCTRPRSYEALNQLRARLTTNIETVCALTDN